MRQRARRSGFRRACRWLALGVVAVLLLLVLALLFRNPLLHFAAVRAARAAGAELHVGTLAWGLKGTLEAGDVSASAAGVAVEVRQVSAAWRWRELFDGRLRRLALVGPVVRIDADRQQTTARTPQETTKDRPASPAATPYRLDAVDVLSVTDARIVLQREGDHFPFMASGTLRSVGGRTAVDARVVLEEGAGEAQLTADLDPALEGAGSLEAHLCSASLQTLAGAMAAFAPVPLREVSGAVEAGCRIAWSGGPAAPRAIELAATAHLARLFAAAPEAAVGLYDAALAATSAVSLVLDAGGVPLDASGTLSLTAKSGLLALGLSPVHLEQAPLHVEAQARYNPDEGPVLDRLACVVGSQLEVRGRTHPAPDQPGHNRGDLEAVVRDLPGTLQLARTLFGVGDIPFQAGGMHLTTPIDSWWEGERGRFLLRPTLRFEELDLVPARAVRGVCSGEVALRVEMAQGRPVVREATSALVAHLDGGNLGGGLDLDASPVQLTGDVRVVPATGAWLDRFTIGIASAAAAAGSASWTWHPHPAGAARIDVRAQELGPALALAGPFFRQPLPADDLTGSGAATLDLAWQRASPAWRVTQRTRGRLTDVGGAALEGKVFYGGLALDLESDGALVVDATDGLRGFDGTGRIAASAGEFLYDTLYLDFGLSPLRLRLEGASDDFDRWRLRAADLDLGGIFSATAAGDLTVSSSAADLRLGGKIASGPALGQLIQPAFEVSHPVLAGAIMEGPVALTGRVRRDAKGLALEGAVRWEDGLLFLPAGGNLLCETVSLNLPLSLAAAPAGLRAPTDALSGTVPAGRLTVGWLSNALAIMEGIDLPFRLARNRWELLERRRVPVWGGALMLDRIEIADVLDPLASSRLDCRLDGLDLAEICRALGAPVLEGELSSTPVRIDSHQSHAVLVEEAVFGAFGGEVVVRAASCTVSPGRLPRYGVSLALREIDLTRLTSFLGLGYMSGVLEGNVRDLRFAGPYLQSFDIVLRSVERRGTKQQITTETLQFLTSMGNTDVAGTVTALFGEQTRIPYRFLGLHAWMADNKVYLEGLTPGEGDLTVILRGGTLLPVPRNVLVTVSRRQPGMSPADFFGRLEAAYEGTVSQEVKIGFD